MASYCWEYTISTDFICATHFLYLHTFLNDIVIILRVVCYFFHYRVFTSIFLFQFAQRFKHLTSKDVVSSTLHIWFQNPFIWFCLDSRYQSIILTIVEIWKPVVLYKCFLKFLCLLFSEILSEYLRFRKISLATFGIDYHHLNRRDTSNVGSSQQKLGVDSIFSRSNLIILFKIIACEIVCKWDQLSLIKQVIILILRAILQQILEFDSSAFDSHINKALLDIFLLKNCYKLTATYNE